MEAQNILYGDINDLKELRTLLENHVNIGNSITAMNIEKQKLEKEFATEEKLMQENIEFTIKKRRDQIVGDMASQGTTPRQLTDLIGSLCDLTSGSGDKGEGQKG